MRLRSQRSRPSGGSSQRAACSSVSQYAETAAVCSGCTRRTCQVSWPSGCGVYLSVCASCVCVQVRAVSRLMRPPAGPASLTNPGQTADALSSQTQGTHQIALAAHIPTAACTDQIVCVRLCGCVLVHCSRWLGKRHSKRLEKFGLRSVTYDMLPCVLLYPRMYGTDRQTDRDGQCTTSHRRDASCPPLPCCGCLSVCVRGWLCVVG